MNAKACHWTIFSLALALVITGAWLGFLYRDRGDTQDHLAETQQQLSAALTGSAGIAEQLRQSAESLLGLKTQQRESEHYQRELEDELSLRAGYIESLESAIEDGTASLGRIDDLLGVGAGLLAEGNRFIEDGKE